MAHKPPSEITPGMKGPMSLKTSKDLFLEMQAALHPGIPKVQRYKLHTSKLFKNMPPIGGKRPRRLGAISRK